ncbi:MAG TPA: TrkH family potassium uptake protein, partial [Candidatus Ozemobacteraceae bacterium]|nr:TrkH family potassium uptake protein [Candidatus Ozemobacteraceae bacterium]
LMLLPLTVALLFQEWTSVLHFAITGGLAWWIGRWCGSLVPSRSFDDLDRLEGMAVVALGWFAISVFGAIPYLCSRLSLIDSLFESMSGFTTTGATVFTDFSIFSRSLFFFRGFTHWVGGMGILVLFVAILPLFSVAGRQLFFAETSAASKDKLTPRIRDTARHLWGWYVFLTLLETALLMACGMSANDAFCNSMATLAAGGFSPHSQSIMGYGSGTVEWIIIVFMFLAGANFTLQVRALRGNVRALWEDVELRGYLAIVMGSTLVLFLLLGVDPAVGGWSLGTLRTALFQNLSILTTTGFGSVDFSLWNERSKVVLVFLMLIGGCSGSAGGGVKVIRILFLMRFLARQVTRAIHLRAVIPIRLGRRIFQDAELQPILGFIAAYFALFLVGGSLASVLENDMSIGFLGALATLGNIGPGFGPIGPMGSFAGLTTLTKALYFFLMWAGRLEVITLFVLFEPSLWRGAFTRREG